MGASPAPEKVADGYWKAWRMFRNMNISLSCFMNTQRYIKGHITNKIIGQSVVVSRIVQTLTCITVYYGRVTHFGWYAIIAQKQMLYSIYSPVLANLCTGSKTHDCML